MAQVNNPYKRIVVSRLVPRRHAATIPIAIPRKMAKDSPKTTRTTVRQIRSLINSVTSLLVAKEIPQSPLNKLRTYAVNCVSKAPLIPSSFNPSRLNQMGLSRPKFTRMRSCASAVIRGLWMINLTGSPGKTRKRKKLKIITTNRVTIAKKIFRSR